MKKTLLGISCLLAAASAWACSTIVVGKDASATGRVIMGHNEDDGGPLLVRHALVPARDHAVGEKMVAERDAARIPQVRRTASFYWGEVKNAKAGGPANADLFFNEYGVLVASDNAAPVAPAVDKGTLVEGGLKYNLRRAIGERATSARAGVELALDLVAKWGYAMAGRLYIIADRDEAWVLQIVKGQRAIARRVPDDAVVTIPNCYVFGRPEPGDLMTPAVAAEAAADPDYDFARTYQGADRWRQPTDVLRWKYMSLAVGLKGELVFADKPSRKVGVEDLKRAFTTHYEGTPDAVVPPHNLPRERSYLAVCRDTTVECTLCAFAETPAATHLQVATGSPCKTPFVDICPFAGSLPADCAVGGAAVKRLENHVFPEPTALPLEAEAVWIEGAEREFNAFYGFYATFEAKEGDAPLLTLAASASARVYVNGRFAGYGPARAAEGFMRLDRRSLSDFVRPGLNCIAIEAGNPAVNGFYLPESAGFLLAEVRAADGRLLAKTGRDFKAQKLPRVQKTNRLSYQREFGEFYRVTPASYAWRTQGIDGAGEKLVAVPKMTALERGAPYPDCHFDGTFKPTRLTKMRRNAAKPLAKSASLDNAGRTPFKGYRTEDLEVNLAELQRLEVVSNVVAEGTVLPRTLNSGDGVVFKAAYDVAGFPYLEVTCVRPCKVWVMMDEIVGADGLPNFLRMGSFNNAVGWELKEPGRYVLEAFQPTGAGAAHIVVEDGAATLERFDFRTYVNPLPGRAKFRSSDPAFDLIFASAGRSLANNAVDLFTDCPGRERGSYFGDTTFTGRGADVLLGDLTIESTLYENYALAKEFRDVPKGMIPMCYPGDVVLAQPHWIAAFGLWSAIQLVEHVARSGNQTVANLYRARAEGILGWFRAARNRDGLLENLPGWVFVEWSRAARFTKGVNYPTNMIYIRFLDAMAKLYGRADCAEEAARLRAVVRREAWNGTWFRDQSIRNKDGVLEPQENYSEICQTLAFFSGVATTEGDADLWQRLVYGLGPMRPQGANELIWPSNMLFGFSLRFGMLVNAGLYRRAMDETKVCCLPMAELTGTLWEGMPIRGDQKTSFSLCHGFPCQSAWVIAQSALGLRKIDRQVRTVTVATPPADIPLDWAEAEIPLTATESAKFAMRRVAGEITVDVELPAPWRLLRQ